ncbi:hypothetical protein Dda_0745 [Drechslerella dactyloides]|uniref:Uncharacterized protein n=1 Tax=Drechslerella dactyloides TaxID=74499 RepID=A0AAD6NMA1_DREDA|nr:hypothetical protein Dda_0745 [Drechslerella dactyloides]
MENKDAACADGDGQPSGSIIKLRAAVHAVVFINKLAVLASKDDNGSKLHNLQSEQYDAGHPDDSHSDFQTNPSEAGGFNYDKIQFYSEYMPDRMTRTWDPYLYDSHPSLDYDMFTARRSATAQKSQHPDLPAIGGDDSRPQHPDLPAWQYAESGMDTEREEELEAAKRHYIAGFEAGLKARGPESRGPD